LVNWFSNVHFQVSLDLVSDLLLFVETTAEQFKILGRLSQIERLFAKQALPVRRVNCYLLVFTECHILLAPFEVGVNRRADFAILVQVYRLNVEIDITAVIQHQLQVLLWLESLFGEEIKDRMVEKQSIGGRSILVRLVWIDS